MRQPRPFSAAAQPSTGFTGADVGMALEFGVLAADGELVTREGHIRSPTQSPNATRLRRAER